MSLRRGFALVLFVLISCCLAAPFAHAQSDTQLTREVQARVANMQKACVDFETERKSACTEPDMTLVPGRAGFISWSLSAIPALEKEGHIVKDDDFLQQDIREVGTGGVEMSQMHASAAGLFDVLGRLRAQEAIPVLAQYLLASPENDIDNLFESPLRVYPATRALIGIGESALPTMLDAIRRKDNRVVTINCAYVIGCVLGEKGPAYMKEHAAADTDPAVQARFRLAAERVGALASAAAMRRRALERKARQKAAESQREVFE